VRGSWQKKEDVDLATRGEALDDGAFVRDASVPFATDSTPSGRERAPVGETPQAAEPEACSGRQVVQAESERYRAGGGAACLGARERLSVVVVTVDKKQLEAGATKQGTGGSEGPAKSNDATASADSSTNTATPPEPTLHTHTLHLGLQTNIRGKRVDGFPHASPSRLSRGQAWPGTAVETCDGPRINPKPGAAAYGKRGRKRVGVALVGPRAAFGYFALIAPVPLTFFVTCAGLPL
jgi:hypothetical protein